LILNVHVCSSYVLVKAKMSLNFIVDKKWLLFLEQYHDLIDVGQKAHFMDLEFKHVF
jgi:hypothetical protein